MASELIPRDGDDTLRHSTSTLQVQDAGRILEFEGELVAAISTETDGPRWLEMDLYKLSDGTGRYVLHLVGRSVVYHERHSPCNRGIPQKPGDPDWTDDAESCITCTPEPWRVILTDVAGVISDDPLWVPGYGVEGADWHRRLDMEYDLEMDRHTSYVCASADGVVDRLKESSRQQRASGTLSAPAQRLLDEAARVDRGIASATTVIERL